MAKDSFILFLEQEAVFENLSDEQAGKLIKTIFHYEKYKEIPPLDQLLNLVFIPIKQSLDRNTEKYEKIVERNKKNISNRWNNKDTKNTTGKTGKKENTKNTDNDNEHDSVPDNDNVNDSVNDFLFNEEEDIYTYFEKNFSRTLSPVEMEQIENWKNEYDNEIIRLALKTSLLNGVKNFRYIEVILNNWKGKTIEEIKLVNQKREKSKLEVKELFDYDWLNED